MVKECSVCGSKSDPEARFCSACGARFKEHVEFYDAFVSYRRESGSHIAALLKLLLEDGFKKRVFLDVDELQMGRFDERLLDLIGSTPNFILILSAGCLERCVEKNDWLKREIVHAFEKRRNIIPVLLEGFDFPGGSQLEMMPDAMRVLPNLQGVTYSHVHRESAVRRIAEYMVASIPDEDIPPPQPDAEPILVQTTDLPVESDHTELQVVGHDGTSTSLYDPSIAYPGGFGPSRTTDGIAVRRGVEEATLKWSRLRLLKFRSRQEKSDKGTTVWRHTVEATLPDGKVIEAEVQADWNMAYMGGGGTGLLFGQTDLGEAKIPFSEISILRTLKYARPDKK
jgi:hypothetical protein